MCQAPFYTLGWPKGAFYILGWPKGQNIVWKNPDTLFGQPNILDISIILLMVPVDPRVELASRFSK